MTLEAFSRPQAVFGVGKLHHLPTSCSRQRLLREAIEIGFRAFDVAPAYGNGLNELEVGKALKGDRSAFRITTKFGIPIDLYGERCPSLAYIIRVWRRIFATNYGAEYSKRVFTAHEMRSSLEGSLRRLKRDWVDIYLLHEPVTALRADQLTDLCDTADRLKQEGKIRWWGVAGPLASVKLVAEALRPDVVQVPLQDVAEFPDRRGKHMIAYNCYTTFRRSDASGRTDFVSYVKSCLDELGADIIVTTTRRKLLAAWKGLFE